MIVIEIKTALIAGIALVAVSYIAGLITYHTKCRKRK